MNRTVYDRTEMLLGTEALAALKAKSVIVFGVGGVGGHLVEALARTGIGRIGIVDYDTVDITNINRQIIALHSTLGRHKAQVMAERVGDINPEIQVEAFCQKLDDSSLSRFRIGEWDYAADAIDDVPGKLLLIKEACRAGTPVISSMGTGNKRNPALLTVSRIEKTHTCPLARAVRKELRSLGIEGVKVVFSPEEPQRAAPGEGPASIAFVPAAAGLLLASEIVSDLIKGGKF